MQSIHLILFSFVSINYTFIGYNNKKTLLVYWTVSFFLVHFISFFLFSCGKNHYNQEKKITCAYFYLKTGLFTPSFKPWLLFARASACAIFNAYVEIPNIQIKLMVEDDGKYDFFFKWEFTTFILNLSLIFFPLLFCTRAYACIQS